MTDGNANAPDQEMEALRRQIAEQQAISQQLTRYVADLHTLLSERDIARHAAVRASRTRDDLLAQMSIDLRQPLGTIIGFAQVLLQQQRPERDRDALVRILDAGLSMDRVVDALLHRAREPLDELASGNRIAMTAIYEVVRRAVGRLRNASGFNLRVEDAPPLLVDLTTRIDTVRFTVALEHIILSIADQQGTLTLGARRSDSRESVILEMTLDEATALRELPATPLATALLKSVGVALDLSAASGKHVIALHVPTDPPEAE